MHHTHASREMTACIQACLDCYRHCQHTALTHCLEMGGEHVEPAHFRLMIDCAEVCRTSAAMMINDSSYHAETCRLCAEVCRDCAESCRALGDMDECVRACEQCAESCEAMAARAGSHGTERTHRSAAVRPQ